ncbi:MAG: D-aminoacyl-tRNA deacylase [Actinomycetota bacterium]
MRAVLQRVTSAQVVVDGAIVGSIDRGLLVFVGVGEGDTADDAARLADQIVHLRIFGDEAGKMNLAVSDVNGAVLVVSQFTLHADTSRGRRPSFTRAAPPEHAAAMVERLAVAIADSGVRVANGSFGAHMEVTLVNDGPVTIVLDTTPD